VESNAGRVVILETEGAIDPELEATLRELLARNGIELRRVEQVPEGRVIADVRIKGNAREARVSIRSEHTQGSRFERELKRSGSPELFRETLAHLIVTAIDPLAVMNAPEPAATRAAEPSPAKGTEQERTETAPVAPPRPAPDPAPKEKVTTKAAVIAESNSGASTQPQAPDRAESETNARISLALRAFVGPTLIASDETGWKFGGGAALVFESALHPAVILDAGYMLPLRARRERLDATLRMLPLRARFRIEPLTWSALSLEGSLNGGVNILTFSSSSPEPEVHTRSSTERVQPILGASLGARAHLSKMLTLILSSGIEMDLAPRRFVVEQGREQRDFLETARFMPFATLGFEWQLGRNRTQPEREDAR
jgi:hypothetical protein